MNINLERKNYLDKILTSEYYIIKQKLKSKKNTSIELFLGLGTAPKKDNSNEIPIGWLTYIKSKLNPKTLKQFYLIDKEYRNYETNYENLLKPLGIKLVKDKIYNKLYHDERDYLINKNCYPFELSRCYINLEYNIRIVILPYHLPTSSENALYQISDEITFKHYQEKKINKNYKLDNCINCKPCKSHNSIYKMIYKMISLCYIFDGETLLYNRCIYKSNIPLNNPYTHKFIKYCRIETGHHLERFSELGYVLYKLLKNGINPYITSINNCYKTQFEKLSSKFTIDI